MGLGGQGDAVILPCEEPLRLRGQRVQNGGRDQLLADEIGEVELALDSSRRHFVHARELLVGASPEAPEHVEDVGKLVFGVNVLGALLWFRAS